MNLLAEICLRLPFLFCASQVCLDIFTEGESTLSFFYTNDQHVLVDIILRETTDLPAPDEMRCTYLQLLHQVLLHSDWLHQVCVRCHAICYLLCSCFFFDPLMLCLLDTCRVGTAAKISAQPWRASSTLGSNRARRCTQTQLKPQSLSSATALACWSEMRRANGDGWSDATVMRRARSLILFCYAAAAAAAAADGRYY